MMRKTLAALLLLLACAMALSAQSDWIKYTSKEGRYSVLLPREPELKTQEAATSTGAKFLQYLAQSQDVENPNGGFMVAYFHYLPEMNFNLDKARDDIVA